MFEQTYTIFVEGENAGETDSMSSAVRLGKAMGVPFQAIGPAPKTEIIPESDGASIRFSLLELE